MLKNLNLNILVKLTKTQLTFVIVYGLLIVAFAILLTFTILSIKKINYDRKSISFGKSNVRIFAINYREDKVYAVDKRNLKDKKIKDLNWLYSSVIPSDKTRFKNWIQELSKRDHTVPHNIEVHVYVNSLKANIFSVFEVSSINYEKNIIHMESHLFPNINKIKKDKNSKIFIKSEDAMPSVLEENQKDCVTVYNIRLFSAYEFDSSTKFKADHIVITQIMNRLVKYLNHKRYMSLLKSNEIIITDFSLSNSNGAVAFGHSFAKEVSRILLLNSLQKQFSFKIGIVQDRFRNKSFQELVKTAKEMSIFAEDNEIDSPVILYDSALNYHQLSQNSIIDEVNLLIENDEIIKKYTPIYNGKDNALLVGYYVEFIPNKSLLTSISEIEEYAYNNGLSNKLLKSLFNSSHVPLIGTDSSVFMNIGLPYYNDILQLFYEGNELIRNTIFVFEDKDISSFVQEGTSAVQVLERLVQSGIILALSFTSSTLTLSDDILDKFSFYILDERNFPNILTSSQNQILFQGLLNKLSSMDVPLICTKVASWQSLEYLGKSGINYFSTELVGFAFDSLPEIDERKFTKAIETFGIINK